MRIISIIVLVHIVGTADGLYFQSSKRYLYITAGSGWIVRYKHNFTCTGTFLTCAHIQIQYQKCHRNSQLGWDHVTTKIGIRYNYPVTNTSDVLTNINVT